MMLVAIVICDTLPPKDKKEKVSGIPMIVYNQQHQSVCSMVKTMIPEVAEKYIEFITLPTPP